NLAVFNRLGTLPTRNFQQATFDDAEALSGESLTENSFSRRHGCASCTIQCERLFKSLAGEEQRLEYETLFALGPLCGINDPEVVLQAPFSHCLYPYFSCQGLSNPGQIEHGRQQRLSRTQERRRNGSGPAVSDLCA